VVAMTTYQEIFALFTNKITDYSLPSLTQDEAEFRMMKFLDSSISRFIPYCHKDLTDRDDTLKQFNIDLSTLEKEILALMMVYEWTNNFVLSEEFLKQRLGTKDYQIYSPANHLKELIQLRSSIQNEIDDLIKLYYYTEQ
jgi:hypothetical protein